MKIFGVTVWKPKALTTATPASPTVVSSGGSGGWFSIVREAFAGAWQENWAVGGTREVMAFSAVFACVTGIAGDIAKLRVKMMELKDTGIGQEVDRTAPHYPVLIKPNHCQNRIQFFAHWIICLLLYGNVYVLKVRDRRGIVTEMYILDPQRVSVLVAETGDVYYRLSRDVLSGLQELITVPANEIIHDRINCLWHPLVGVSPIYACALSATQGLHIQKNSSKFFKNMSRPSGTLTSAGTINEETAKRMKAEWDENFSGENIGRLAVLGDGLKYEAMAIPANEAQLIEQLKWTVDDVARCFHYPVFKLGGQVPPNTSVGALEQIYYSDCLQPLIEGTELSLDAGLDLPADRYTEFDLEGLLRMDPEARYKSKSEAVKGGWMKPDEARAGEDLLAVPGGDACYLQQQNFSLAALAKRDALPNPFVIDKPTPNPTPSSAGPATTADPATAPAATVQADERWLVDLAQDFTQGLAEVDYVESMAERLAAAMKQVESAALGQTQFAAHIDRLAQVLAMPTEPVYDERGVLIGARRVGQLKEIGA